MPPTALLESSQAAHAYGTWRYDDDRTYTQGFASHLRHNQQHFRNAAAVEAFPPQPNDRWRSAPLTNQRFREIRVPRDHNPVLCCRSLQDEPIWRRAKTQFTNVYGIVAMCN